MTIASILGEFASNITFEYLPKEVVKRAKACIIDTLGVIIGGIDTEQSRKVVSLVEEMGGKQEATVFGGKRKAPAINAALANGTTAHALDLDDGHAMAQLHPGSCVIPAALAMSEREDSSGRDLITAVIVGYEVMIRIGMAINPGHRDRGFHSTGTCGVFGAAAACGKILGLDAEEMVSALGLAGTQSSGLLESDHRGTMAKALHAGRAAQNGAYSAMLAKMGFTGPDTILEGREGFFRAYGERCRMEEIERGLGSSMR
jgi:2-methylcitrate dehydratase PrpD